ncbi:MAG TPA: hemolysin family protein [Actinomycetota bacterium]|nr:hemolysin family protein [Actinomycetota bacterium]
MNALLTNLAVVLLFTLIGGFFAAAETALVSLRESQVDHLASTQGSRGRRLKGLVADPNRFLAAVQVGVTLAGFLSAGFGASRIAPQVTPWLQAAGLPVAVAAPLAFVAVTILIAYLSLVLGELVPKRLALQRAEAMSLAVAGPVDALARVSRPFIWLLSASTNAVVRLLGGDPRAAKQGISGEELRSLVAAQESLSPEERRLIDEVITAGGRELAEVMRPRTEVDFLDASLPISDAVAKVKSMPHSRYPVVQGLADDVLGFVHLRDLLDPATARRSAPVRSLVRPVPRFPDSRAVLSTMHEMRDTSSHMAIVVDEYGGTAGIVTMEDLVEELVGDIRDEFDLRAPTTIHPGGQVEVDGLLSLDDLAEESGLRLPEGPFETVAGFIVAQLSRLPEAGDVVEFDSSILTVTAMDGRRIARVLVALAPATEPDQTE